MAAAAVSKDDYTTLLFNLLEKPQVKAQADLCDLFKKAADALMADENPELTTSQREDYRWTKQLLGPDEKIRDVVREKLISIHGSPKTEALVTTISALTLQNIAPPPPQLPDIAFGAKQWKEFLGVDDVGEEPPLPPDIEKILSSGCPFFFGRKKIRDTHMLVLVPKTVNGGFLTLGTLKRVIGAPELQTPARLNCINVPEDNPVPESHWVLMTKDILPETRMKTFEEQCKIISTAPGYECPNFLDTVVCILTEFFRTPGTRLYSSKPTAWTRCIDKLDQLPLTIIVGGFSKDCLNIGTVNPNVAVDYIGMGAMRRL